MERRRQDFDQATKAGAFGGGPSSGKGERPLRSAACKDRFRRGHSESTAMDEAELAAFYARYERHSIRAGVEPLTPEAVRARLA